MCSPVAHASMSLGDAAVSSDEYWKSLGTTFPAPPPPPEPGDCVFCSPQTKFWTSISFLCLASVLSPGMPSIFRK